MSIVISAIHISGCAAYHEPLSRTVVQPGPAPDLSALHVRVRRPPDDDIIRTANSERVLSALSRSDTFASVAWEEGVSPEPSVLIRAVSPPPRGHCDADAFMATFLTLGIAPDRCERDRGVYFRPVDQQYADFACPWPQTQLIGWLPALLVRCFGKNWTRQPNVEAFQRHVRACIASKAEASSVPSRP